MIISFMFNKYTRSVSKIHTEIDGRMTLNQIFTECVKTTITSVCVLFVLFISIADRLLYLFLFIKQTNKYTHTEK